MELTPQQIEEFRSEQLLGCINSFGQTFKGHIPHNSSCGLQQMDVAITVSRLYRRTESAGRNLEMQFNNELKLCSLRHKNIISLIGFAKTSDHFYLVHEMVHGRPLSEVIEEMTWGNALKILKGIASALAYLHTHPEGPFVHSNICTHNVLVTQDFTPKIMDFRHCVVEGQPRTGGTPGYCPTDQEGTTTKRADTYAFGVLALQLVTKDPRIVFIQGTSVHHILELYRKIYEEKLNIVNASYGQQKGERNLSEWIIKCVQKGAHFDMTDFCRCLGSLRWLK